MARLTRGGDSVYLTADTPGHRLEPAHRRRAARTSAEHEGPNGTNITFAGPGGKVYFTANNELWESDDAWPEAEVHPIADDPDFPTTAKNARSRPGTGSSSPLRRGLTGTMQSWPASTTARRSSP